MKRVSKQFCLMGEDGPRSCQFGNRSLAKRGSHNVFNVILFCSKGALQWFGVALEMVHSAESR